MRDPAGESVPETEKLGAGKNNGAGWGVSSRESETTVSSACSDLQALQRRRASAIKSRIAIDNQLTALVALELGYFAGMSEEDREARWKTAGELIKSIDAGDDSVADLKVVCSRVAGVVENTRIARAGFDKYVKNLEKEMVKLAAELQAAKWAESIRGFGLLRLAVVIGETGDLSLYSNPGKVWKRLGLAPHNGKMPSTWRSGKEGKLSAEEWTAIGYSPRRRSIMYVVGELLVKLNDGDYRKRYDEAKASKQPLVDSKAWSKGRAHSHGMLLCVKRLVRDLWVQWRLPEKAREAGKQFGQ